MNAVVCLWWISVWMVDAVYSGKVCMKCRYFLYHYKPNQGKCAAFPFVPPVDHATERQRLAELLVTGYAPPIEMPPIDYTYCTTARTDETMCGVEGTRFEPKF